MWKYSTHQAIDHTLYGQAILVWAIRFGVDRSRWRSIRPEEDRCGSTSLFEVIQSPEPWVGWLIGSSNVCQGFGRRTKSEKVKKNASGLVRCGKTRKTKLIKIHFFFVAKQNMHQDPSDFVKTKIRFKKREFFSFTVKTQLDLLRVSEQSGKKTSKNNKGLLNNEYEVGNP